MRSLLLLGCGILLVVLVPAMSPAALSSATLGLALSVVVLIVARWQLALVIVILGTLSDDLRSVLPFGVHILAGSVAFGVIILLQRRILSGHSQSQVITLTMISLFTYYGFFMAARGLERLLNADWILPPISDTLSGLVVSAVIISIASFVYWPFISRRWLALQRVGRWT